MGQPGNKGGNMSCRQDMLELCGTTMDEAVASWQSPDVASHRPPPFAGNVTSCGRLPISYLFATALPHCHIASHTAAAAAFN